jgi:hypothetical protein
VLEGKGRTLARFRDRLARLATALAGLDTHPSAAEAPTRGRGGQEAGASRRSPAAADRGNVANARFLHAQEELRRDIVRLMHDGPAQSLANIALQAEIVQRLASRGDARVAGELASLRAMVQAALDTTKEFIFEVRPMVLDDLGLVPSLRRLIVDRGRRVGIEVVFDSQGPLRRLHPDLESGLYRIVAEAATGYFALRPDQLVVRLEWTERELFTSVQASWAAPAAPSSLPRPDVQLDDDVPPALRAMIEQNLSDEQQARVAARSLRPEALAAIGDRARSLGIGLIVRDDGASLDLTAPLT